MKCSLDRFNVTFKIFLLKLVLTYSVFNMESVVAGESKKDNSILMDFDYLVSQLYLQHCTFVEIGEGICSMFVELSIDSGCKKLQKQMFFGNCLCSEFQKWHLCNYHLTSQRPEDCAFQEGTTCPSTSARVHRRLCDVTGMSQWNPQCNCSVAVAGDKQDHLCGFRTCYVSPMPKSICGPRTVCGTAHCDLRMHGALYSVRCDRKCRYHQPFCEDPCPATTQRRTVTSEWAEWKSVSSDSNCNIKQFETECLNERKEPAYDCIGPGLLCCGKNEADCTCEVKIQDGKLRAFRYMITFEDRCETEDSRIKVRSTRLKGDAKVWNRFIGITSKEDKDDSISMFGKPLGLESFRRNYILDGQKNIASNVMDVSLKDAGKTDARLTQQLTSLITNQSQSHQNIQGVNFHNVSGINNTAKFESLNLKNLPANKTTNPVKFNPQGQQLVKPNGGQTQIQINSTINTNLTPNVLNQQKDMQQFYKIVKEKAPYNFAPLPYYNTTNSGELQEKNSSNAQYKTGGVGNISNDINQKLIKDAKSSAEQSVINNNLNTGNITEHQNNIQNLSETNQQRESGDNVAERYKEISKNSSTNSVRSRPDMSTNQNVHLENSMVTTHQNSSLNEVTTNHKENSLDSQVANVKNEVKTNEQQNKEIKDNKQSLEILNYINNPQKPLSIKSDTQDNNKLEKTNDDNKQNKEEKVGINTNEEKLENENKVQNISIDGTYLGSIVSEIKNDDLKNAEDTLKRQEKVPKVGSKLNSDISREKDIQESEKTENVVNQEELSEIELREDRAKNQEQISVHDEDKVQLNEKGYYQVGFPEHEEKYTDGQEKKEIEHSETSKIMNREITPTQKGRTTPLIGHKTSTERSYNNPSRKQLVSKEITKDSTNTTLYTHPMSLSQNKQHISGLSNPVKFTTVGLEHSKVINTKNEERSTDDQNSQQSLLNNSPSAEFVELPQKNNSAGISQGKHKGESSNKQTMNKKAPLNDIPTATPNGITALSTNPSLRSYLSNKNENERNSQKSSLNEMPNRDNTSQKNTSVTAVQSQNKEELVKKQAVNKNGSLNDVVSTLTNITHDRTTAGAAPKHIPDSSIIYDIERNSQNSSPKELPGLGISLQKSNSSSVIPKDTSKEEPVKDRKAPLNDISNILPNVSPYGVTEMTKKPRVNPHLDKEDEENVIKLSIQTKTTPDLWGSIARRLFKSHSQLVTDDQLNPLTIFSNSNPSIALPEENPCNDYDEPEPVLKDLNKVDKDNVDEKTAVALSKIADLTKLPGKVEWSEKSVNHNYKLDFEKNKNQKDKENINSSNKIPLRNEKRRRLISKLKPIS